MKIGLLTTFFFFMFSTFTLGQLNDPLNLITLPLPDGKISEIPLFSPASPQIQQKNCRFVDPSIGLSSVQIDRLLGDSSPLYLNYLDTGQRNKLALLLLRASSNSSSNKGEILVVTGNRFDGCGKDVRLVVLSDGNFQNLASGLRNYPFNPQTYLYFNGKVSREILEKNVKSKNCSCSDWGLNGLYGSEICSSQELNLASLRNVYIVTPGETYEEKDWSQYAYCPNDPPLSKESIENVKLLNEKLPGKIDIIISSPNDRSALTASLFAAQRNMKFSVDEYLGINYNFCNRRYSSWRLLNNFQSLIENTDIPSDIGKRTLRILESLPKEYSTILLVAPPEIVQPFLLTTGKSIEKIGLNSIISLTIKNSTGIPFFQYNSIDVGYTDYKNTLPVYECPNRASEDKTLNLDLLKGEKEGYSIPEKQISDLSPAELEKYVLLKYEREVWIDLYLNLHIFTENLIRREDNILYWGRFPVQKIEFDLFEERSSELIGQDWIDFWRRNF